MIFEIVLSTVATISFVVIVIFVVVIRRLYMKNMTYREIEQGEFCTYGILFPSLLMFTMVIVVIKPWKPFLVV